MQLCCALVGQNNCAGKRYYGTESNALLESPALTFSSQVITNITRLVLLLHRRCRLAGKFTVLYSIFQGFATAMIVK